MQTATLASTWEQTIIPTIIRKTGPGPLLVRLPQHPDNKGWLRAGRVPRPKWNEDRKRWELPQAWFAELVAASLQRYGQVYVINDPAQKCAYDHAPEVCETSVVSWAGSDYACRLLRREGVSTPDGASCQQRAGRAMLGPC